MPGRPYRKAPENKQVKILDIKCPILVYLEFGELFALLGILLAPGYNVQEVLREHERHALPDDAELLLVVAEKVAKVNVEDLALAVDHDVVGVPVANPEDEGGDAVARATKGERLDRLVHVVLVLLPDPLVQLRRVHLDGGQPGGFLLNFVNGFGVSDDLNHADMGARREAIKRRKM